MRPRMNFNDKTTVEFEAGHVCLDTDLESDRFILRFSLATGMVSYNYSVWKPGEDWLARLTKWAIKMKEMTGSESPLIAKTEYILRCTNGMSVGELVLPECFELATKAMAKVFEVNMSQIVIKARNSA